MRREKPLLVILHSGLGNQMFQYAAARAIAARRDCQLYLDVTSFQNNAFRMKYELGNFRLSERCLPNPPGITPGIWPRLTARLFREAECIAMERWGRYYLHPLKKWVTSYERLVSEYFQSPMYFAEIQETIRSEYQLRNEPAPKLSHLAELLRKNESVGVHVRMKHGVSLTGAVISPRLVERGLLASRVEYYRAAIAQMKARVPKPWWVIVTDTCPFQPDCLDLPRDTTVLYGDPGRSPAEDLWLLSQCKHKIIAPSTFSWWAAWLTDAEQNLVFAPRVFAPSGSTPPSRDIYPPGWMTL